MKYLAIILSIIVLIIGVYSIFKAIRINNQTIAYEKVIQFSKNRTLQFPDFKIVSTGVTREQVTPNLNFTYYNFLITDLNNATRTLIWSSGTGEVAPKDFVIGNKVYQLELGYSNKDNKWISNDELVISPSKTTIPEYLFQLIVLAEYSLPEGDDSNTITKRLGFTFKETENSNQYFNILTSEGFSPISHAELRIKKNDHKIKLLTLTVDTEADISYDTMLKKYPDAQISVSDPNDPTYIGLVVSDSSQKTIFFGFDRNYILTSIILDSTERQK